MKKIPPPPNSSPSLPLFFEYLLINYILKIANIYLNIITVVGFPTIISVEIFNLLIKEKSNKG